MIHYLLQEFEGDTAKIWQSNIFGKSFHELVGEDLNAKVKRMPEDARGEAPGDPPADYQRGLRRADLYHSLTGTGAQGLRPCFFAALLFSGGSSIIAVTGGRL